MMAQYFHAILQEQRCCYHYQGAAEHLHGASISFPIIFFPGEESGSGERAVKLSRWKPLINHEQDTGDFPFHREFLLRKESMSAQWSIASPHCVFCDVWEFYAPNDPCVALYQRYGNGWRDGGKTLLSPLLLLLGGFISLPPPPTPKTLQAMNHLVNSVHAQNLVCGLF